MTVLPFFAVTFAVSWVFFTAAGAVPFDAASPQPGPAALRGALFLLGTVAPSLVALALTGREQGRAAVVALLRRIAIWPAQIRWYLFALAYFPVIKLGVAAGARLITGAWPPFGSTPVILMMGAIVISTPVQAGEEIGWRGYALPRLARRFGLVGASLMLGVVWACWHLPFFFMPGTDNAGQSFVVYAIAVTSISVALAWLYWRTGGSLLTSMMMHAAINNTASIVSSPPSTTLHPFSLDAPLVAWLTATLSAIGAVYFAVRMRTAKLP